MQKEESINCSEVELIKTTRSSAIHPFLVGLQGTFQTVTDQYFLMEYVNGEKLLFHLQRQYMFDEDSVRWVVSDATISPYFYGLI